MTYWTVRKGHVVGQLIILVVSVAITFTVVWIIWERKRGPKGK